MERQKHFTLTLFLTLGLVFFGTGGYMFIEGWTFPDALYMTDERRVRVPIGDRAGGAPCALNAPTGIRRVW